LLMHDGLMLEVEEANNRTVQRVHVFPRASLREGGAWETI
jgi:hypothetical protein